MARDVEIELDYDSQTVTIVNPDGVYSYDMTDDILKLANDLLEGGAGYSVYSQEDTWTEQISDKIEKRRQLKEQLAELDDEIREIKEKHKGG
ncbi:MAG: hypothetical protein WA102_06835 [Candidatus Methanoperedens sp.]